MEQKNNLPKRVYDAAVAVIGAVMIDPTVSGDVFAQVRPTDFIAPEYRTVFEAEQQLFLADKPIDPISVANITGDGYRSLLMQIMDLTPTAANIREYIQILLDESRLYRLRVLGDQLSTASTLDEAMTMLDQARQWTDNASGMTALSLCDGFTSFCDRQNTTPNYLSFGMEGIDRLAFAELGDFVLLGARPSTGKTMLALQIATYLSKNHRVGFFSLETRDEKLIDRSMAHLFGVEYDKIKRHALDQDDWTQIVQHRNRLQHTNLDIIQATGRTADEIASFSLYKKYNVIVVDYIQLVRTPHKGFNRENEVSLVSNALANFARRHKVAVIALAQLTREREEDRGRSVRAPTLASFRESGALEQDADIALLMYLSEPDNRNSDRILRLAKNKEGRTGKIQLAFDGNHQTFTERIVNDDTFRHISDVQQAGNKNVWKDVSTDTQITVAQFGGTQ